MQGAPKRGLIVMPHYADLIVRGLKTWEMRTTGCGLNETVAIIASGTKTIVGVATVNGSLEPIGHAQMAANENRHRIDPELQGKAVDGGWTYPWVMSEARKLKAPLAFPQKNGAVIWTILDDKTRKKLASLLAA